MPEIVPEIIEIYDCEASYNYALRPADQTGPAMDPDGSVEPMWGIHLHDPGRGRRMGIIPHARLENAVLEHGHDIEDLSGIVTTILHWPYLPDADDPLTHDDPAAVAVLEATAGVPDPLTPGMPEGERLEATQALVAAVRKHRATVDPASRADRQGALDFRKAAILAAGDRIPAPHSLDLDITAPEHPLDALLSGARLDPARIAARRARAEWVLARRAGARDRRTAILGPRTFGFGRVVPEPERPGEDPVLAAARTRMRGAE